MKGTGRDTKLIEMYHADSNNPAYEPSMYISTAKLTKREKTADSIEEGHEEPLLFSSPEYNMKSKDTLVRGADEDDLVRIDNDEDHDHANEIRSIDIDDRFKKSVSHEAYIKIYDDNTAVTTD